MISYQSVIVSSSILYSFRDIWRWRISWPWNICKSSLSLRINLCTMHITGIYRPGAILLSFILFFYV